MAMKNHYRLSERSVHEIQRLVEDAEALDLSTYVASQLVPRVDAICEGYSWMTQLVGLSAAYRARRIETRPKNVAEVWYPPAHLVKSVGRANDVGESVLYVSSSADTAVLEMRPAVGETLAILQSTLADPKERPHVFDIGLAETNGGGDAKVNAREFHRTPVGRAFLGERQNQEKLGMIRSFLVRQFTRVVTPGKQHEYGLALAIAKSHRSPEMDGLWYPSVAGRLRGTNVALSAEAADRLLRPIGCWMLRVEEALSEMQYSVRCIAKARSISEDRQILW